MSFNEDMIQHFLNDKTVIINKKELVIFYTILYK